MANATSVLQQTQTVSIPKAKLLDIGTNYALTETDLRVLFCLFSELNGWSESRNRRTPDPLNYRRIDKDKIAEVLAVKKKEVKKSIEKLVDMDLLEPGSNDIVKNGYRFTF